MLNTILFFIRPYKVRFIFLLLVTVAASALESLNLAILLPLFNGLLAPSADIFQGIPSLFADLNKLLPFQDPMLSVFALFVAIMLIKTSTDMLREWLKATTSGSVFYDLKKSLLQKYSALSYQTIISQKQGALIYNCTVSSKMVASFLLRLSDVVSESFKILAILIVLAGMQPLPTLIAIGLGLCYYGISHYLSKKVSFKIGKERFVYGTAQNITINELFNGIKSLITFNAVRRWLKEFDTQNTIFTKLYIKDAIWMYVPKYIMELLTAILIFGTVIYLKLTHPLQFVSYLPVIGVFSFALIKLMPSISSMGRARMELLGNLPDLDVVRSSLTDSLPVRRNGGKDIPNFSHSIAFENVSFQYDHGPEIIHNLTMTFEKGRITAIVGASGSGKSSIVNLILGLLEPTQGRITIDARDLKEIDPEQWNALIGLVSQDTFIFHSSIRNNISFGNDKYTQDDIITAAKMAYAHDFISSMPKAYETIVGERGMKLSGGQQQRIAIARAVLRRPEIMIFDEATSALDSVSEKIVQDAIYNLSKNHTIIIIAHRLSTIKNADKIIVLDKGRVVETGVHEELIKTNGNYSKFAQGTVENKDIV